MRFESKSSPRSASSSQTIALGWISNFAGLGRPWFPFEANALPKVEGLRFDWLDTARGLCLFWMCLAHVLALSGAGTGSWLGFLYLPGWSTTNFVMLSGLALGLLSNDRGKRWYRRAGQLLAIAYLSNVLFTLAKETSAEITLSHLGRVMTLQEPWTISCILLPTVVLLCLISAFEGVLRRTDRRLLFVGATVVIILTWLGVSHVSEAARGAVYSSLFEFENPWFLFPLGSLCLLGLWAYSFGLVFQDRNSQALLLFGGLALTFALNLSGAAHPVLYFFRFEATLVIALLFARVKFLWSLNAPLSLLGRSSLLVFLLHRLFLQAEKFTLPPMSPPTKAVVMMGLTLGLCLLVCAVKERYPRFAGALKRVGL